MTESGDERFTLTIPRRWEYILFAVLFGGAVFLRFLYLAADPPGSFSLSTGIETDPAGHAVFARSAALTGEWNPYNDHRFVTYQYSLVSGAAYLVYKMLGVGVYQNNLASVIISLLSLFLFYLALRKPLGNGVALLALFFVGINYIGIFIGRRLFLENGMNLLFIAALFFLVYGQKRLWGHFLFGFFAAAAVLFGKVIALAFLGVPVIYYLYTILKLKDKRGYGQSLAALAGFGFLSAVWYFWVYAPHGAAVSGYLDEQVFGLHGAPEAFESLSKFVWKFMVFGMKDAFFDRMPAISIAALAGVIILSSRLFTRDRELKTAPFKNLILITLAVWLAGTYLGEMPWNYQPLRYLSAMIYPLAALTAVLIVYLFNLRQRVNLLNRSIIFILMAAILMLLLVYHITRVAVVRWGGQFTFVDYFPAIGAMALLLSSAYMIVAWRRRKLEICIPGFIRYSLIALVIMVSVYYQASYYLPWAEVPLYTMRQASRDLGMIISPGAVISGPYGPALAIENNIGAVVHFFGTTRPDPTLFRRFPVTHLAVDEANEKAAREIYPELMARALYVCNYNINCDKVTIYNIAPYTGHPQAAAYVPSLYERSAYFYAAQETDSAVFYLQRFLREYPDNIIANNQAGIYFLVIENYENAVHYFSRAVEFSMTDFKLHFFLGNAYIGLAEATGDNSYRERGEAEIELARKYGLGKFDLDEYIISVPKDGENGKTDN